MVQIRKEFEEAQGAIRKAFKGMKKSVKSTFLETKSDKQSACNITWNKYAPDFRVERDKLIVMLGRINEFYEEISYKKHPQLK